MSDVLGTRVYGENESEVFLGRDVTTSKNMSDDTANLVDSEISRIIDEEYQRAKQILEDHREKVEVMTRCLMEWETIDAGQIAEIMEGSEPTPPADLPTPRSSKEKSGDDDKHDTVSGVKPQMDNPASEA